MKDRKRERKEKQEERKNRERGKYTVKSRALINRTINDLNQTNVI